MPKRKKTEGRNSVDLATDFYSNPNANLVSFEHTGGRWGQHADYEYEAARQTTDAPGVGEASNIKMKVDVKGYSDKYIRSLSPQAANTRRAWEGLSHKAKLLAIETSKKLKDKGKTIIHSAFRSEDQSKEDRQRVGDLTVYKKKWTKGLTAKELSSKPIGSESSKEDKRLRTSAVQKMWDAGLRSRHGNRSGVGNAFDISVKGMTYESAKAIKRSIETPESEVIVERRPLHIHTQLHN